MIAAALLCLSFDDPRAPFGLSHEPVEVAAALRGHHLNLDALASIVEEIGGGNATSLLANVTFAPPPPPPPPPRRRARAASDVRLTVFGVTLFALCAIVATAIACAGGADEDELSALPPRFASEQELGDPAFSEQLPLLQPPMEQRRSRRRSSPSYLFRTVTPPPASCTSSGRASPNRYEHGALWDRLGYRD